MKDSPSVDVIIATFNEEINISNCVKSVLNQTYPEEKIHIFIVDGCSYDNTLAVINKLAYGRKNITIVKNPDRYQAFAWNKAIKLSQSPYISIISAHSVLPLDYLENAINILQTPDIDLTGGHMVAHGIGFVSSAIAKLHHSKFGIGIGKFHDMSFEGFTDTVYTFNLKRQVINEVGLFNTRLIRNQDIELAGRIKNSSSKKNIYLSSKLDAAYVPRNSIVSFVKQYFRNAKFIFETFNYTKGALSIRHLVPLIFILFIPISVYLFFNSQALILLIILSLVWLSYFILDLFYSIKQSDSLLQLLFLIFLHLLLHIVYGIGTLWGGIKMVYKAYIHPKEKIE